MAAVRDAADCELMRDSQGSGFIHTLELSKRVGDSQGVGLRGSQDFSHTHTQKVVHLYYQKNVSLIDIETHFQ